MPENYSSGRDPRRTSRPANARPQGSRPQGSRPQSARPQGSRPQGSRPPQKRRPAPRRKKRNYTGLYILAAIAVALVVVLIITFGGGKKETTVQPKPTPTPAANSSGLSNAVISSQPVTDAGATEAPQVTAASYSQVSQLLEEDNPNTVSIAAADMIQVNDLSINPNLPSDWINVLLLGTDQRTLSESARTDTMIICSINPTTGEVKLTSIMRDTAIEIDEAGEFNGTYRINAANYFGGPEYAMKVVNECFGMNIEHYVLVNFFGFQKIAEALGGIEVDITEAEMEQINHNAVEQAWAGYYAGIDESDQVNEYLTTYGKNTHLNGRQTLAYARIRKIDSDFTRSDRQRTVLVKLLEKFKTKSAAEILALAVSMSEYVTTNMNINDIVDVALRVIQSGLSNVDMLRLPLNNTYKQERRNEQEMFYDCDWQANSMELYNFIYE